MAVHCVRAIQFGKRCECTYGPDGSGAMLTPMVDSSHLLRAGDFDGLRAVLDRDGFLYLKGALPSASVDAAREKVLDHLIEKGDVLADRDAMMLNENCGLGCIPFMEGRNDVTHAPELLEVFEGDAIRALFRGIFDVESVRPFDFKWLRGMPRDGFTGAHVDSVYMGRGTDKLMTCWVPFGVNPVELGALAVCAGSHALPSFAKLRATYGAMDHAADGLDGSGWFSEDPAEILALCPGGCWQTTDFAPGDVVTFGMQTLHMSTSNSTDQIRISADLRFQPTSEPADPRYVGEFVRTIAKAGAWAEAEKESAAAATASPAGAVKVEDEAPKVTIRELRAKWGFPLPEGVDMK